MQNTQNLSKESENTNGSKQRSGWLTSKSDNYSKLDKSWMVNHERCSFSKVAKIVSNFFIKVKVISQEKFSFGMWKIQSNCCWSKVEEQNSVGNVFIQV